MAYARCEAHCRFEFLRTVIYSSRAIEVRQTTVFRSWLDDLADHRAAERIAQRIVRLQVGLMQVGLMQVGLTGDVKPLAEVFRNCVSITGRDIGSISCSAAGF